MQVLLKPLSAARKFFIMVQPMQPVSRKEPLNSPDYIYQIKWDGVRILALVDERQVTLKNRKGRERTAQYPELRKLADLKGIKNAVFDGEVIALSGGKPSFARLIQRDFCSRDPVIRALQRKIPCTYCLFDLLYLNDADLTGRPVEERQRLLRQIVETAPPLYLNDNFDDGGALYREIEQAGMEGIVAKKRGSPYRSGRKSAEWLKIKPRRRQLCAVGGLTMTGGVVGALLLGAYREGELLYIGKAGSGLKEDELLLLRDHALGESSSTPHFSNPPRGRDFLWLEPRMTVQVEFAEWTDDLRMRAPVVLGFTDRPPAEALL